ncbi:hypothetical protein ROSMUCSMR3_03937 [Roseovarius mucosus]|uniref:Uncharacterized protein n=1 Tax=Roseovarius mucosus TaxID=215743 RepID=A0A1V0RUD3_9RHOB|nr:hypothetical protein ROSMUCSMR3_03937 [Roseovarius mucosus]
MTFAGSWINDRKAQHDDDPPGTSHRSFPRKFPSITMGETLDMTQSCPLCR